MTKTVKVAVDKPLCKMSKVDKKKTAKTSRLTVKQELKTYCF
jgi:hypothetical protein